MNAVSSAPTSKRPKKRTGQSDLRELPISTLAPGAVYRASRIVFE
jgi:hypothetical protein